MDLDTLFRNYIGRIVAFVVAPLLAVAAPPVVNFANSILGTEFTDQQLSNIAIATVVGVALVVWQWLRNRGQWETAALELEKLYEAGLGHIEAVEPVAPPGVDA